jgi:FkbM family methyltransferase
VLSPLNEREGFIGMRRSVREFRTLTSTIYRAEKINDMRRVTMNKVRLPNKEEIYCINPAEALLLYEDIYRDRSYLREGITIRDGDCIFDVGANIGLFTLFAKQQAARLQLYVFEPIPPIFEVLSANVQLHNVEAQLFQCGLSTKVSREEFAFYERNSAMSGKYWDPAQEKQVARSILLNKHPDLMDHVDDLLDAGFEPIIFECPLRRLSDVIVESNIPNINLLKIDVEKSEMDVIGGIEEAHWPIIQQIVLEVHDIDERVRTVKQFLEFHGFRTSILQNGFFRGTGLYDVYASRREP